MALTTATALGRVDLPPSFIGLSSPNAAKLSAFVMEFTLNLGTEYVAGTGITFATILTLINSAITASPPTYPATCAFTSVVGCLIIGVRSSANAAKLVIPQQNNSGTGPAIQAFTATTPTEYVGVAGDIWRVLIIGS